MTTARQIIRWSIPGALFWVFAGVAQALLRLLWDPGDDIEIARLVTGTGVIAAAATSVPIGFVIYQIYYATYRPVRFLGQFVAADRGREILKGIPRNRLDRLASAFSAEPVIDGPLPYDRAELPLLRGVFRPLRLRVFRETKRLPREEKRSRRKTAIDDFRIDWHNNWHFVRSLLDAVSITEPTNEIKREYTSLSDIYHALGVAKTSVGVAVTVWGTYVIVRYHEEVASHPWGSLGGFLSVVAVALLLWLAFHRNRAATLEMMLPTVRHGLHWYTASDDRMTRFCPVRRGDDDPPVAERAPQRVRNPVSVVSHGRGSVRDRLYRFLARKWAIITRAVFTAGAASVVLDDDDRVLLVEDRGRDGWGLPGGFMKRGEAPWETARREFLEEVGSELEWPEGCSEVFLRPDGRHFEHLYILRVEKPDAVLQGFHRTAEVSRADWFALDDLPPVQPEVEGALRRVL